jgi:hypothetical protein
LNKETTMPANKDGLTPGQTLSASELQQYLNRKRQEARDAANKPAAKRSSRAKKVDHSGEQPETVEQTPPDVDA